MTLGKYAFRYSDNQLQSIQLNEGLETIGQWCFDGARIRRLVLSSSVKSIESGAFERCKYLQLADLSAARSLQQMGWNVFRECKELKRALLGNGLKSISSSCF